MKRHNLGRYPLVALAAARDAARAIHEGKTPLTPTGAPTRAFASVFDEWMQNDQDHNKCADDVRAMLKLYVLPLLGERDIKSVGKADLHSIFDQLKRDGKKRDCGEGTWLASPHV